MTRYGNQEIEAEFEEEVAGWAAMARKPLFRWLSEISSKTERGEGV
jgi:hypothetical protein